MFGAASTGIQMCSGTCPHTHVYVCVYMNMCGTIIKTMGARVSVCMCVYVGFSGCEKWMCACTTDVHPAHLFSGYP